MKNGGKGKHIEREEGGTSQQSGVHLRLRKGHGYINTALAAK